MIYQELRKSNRKSKKAGRKATGVDMGKTGSFEGIYSRDVL